jgi:hypothetical protein
MDKSAVTGYIGMMLGQISEEDFYRGLKQMGYNVGVHDEDRESGIPDLSGYIGRIEDAFIGYIREKFP